MITVSYFHRNKNKFDLEMRTMIFVFYLSDTDELLNREQKRMVDSNTWCFFLPMQSQNCEHNWKEAYLL